MAAISTRITGKNGQIQMQVGSSQGGSANTCAGNASSVVVDGITYDAYQVWTGATAGPWDPAHVPTVTITGAVPSTYVYDINWMRGMVIVTPGITVAASVVLANGTWYTPKMYAQLDHTEFTIDPKGAMVDLTAAGEGWDRKVVGYRSWTGSMSGFYRGPAFWTPSICYTNEVPICLSFYPLAGASNEHWTGFAYVQWGLKVPMRDAVVQSITFEGTGPLIYTA